MTDTTTSTDHAFRKANIVALGLLLLSTTALGLAPTLMPESYSWLSHTTSESAAQGVRGAWLARLGFMLFGLPVAWMALQLKSVWSIPVRVAHGAFGLLLTATAAFSTRSWLPAAAYDPIENALHSFTATAMGFAFAIGVFLVLLGRNSDWRGRLFDMVAITASVAIPLAMVALPSWDGLLQRGMFAIAYLWYGLALLRTSSRTQVHLPKRRT